MGRERTDKLTEPGPVSKIPAVMRRGGNGREIDWYWRVLLLVGVMLGAPLTAGAEPPAKPSPDAKKHAPSKTTPADVDPLEQFRKANDELRKAQQSLEKAQSQLKQAARNAEGKARAELQEAREQALQAMQTAQQEMRRVAQTMHEQQATTRTRVQEGLDRAQELAREQRRALSQNELWRKLRQKLGDDTSTLSAPVRDELRLHARRTARLQRVEALAQTAGDQAALERVRALLERERARHARWMDALDAKSAAEAAQDGQR